MAGRSGIKAGLFGPRRDRFRRSLSGMPRIAAEERVDNPVRRDVTREEFDAACDAVWTEIEYQNRLPIRTADEAKDVPGFLTLLDRTARKTADQWADIAGEVQADGTVQVSAALHGLRKLAAIAVRAMVYNGVRSRE